MPARKVKKRPAVRHSPVAKVKSARATKPRTAALVRIEDPPRERTFPVEVDPQKVEETLKKLGEEVRHLANKSRYTKVRFKFRGKQLLPDLPLAAVVAAEGLTFYWGGILRAILFNFAGKTVFDVELVNEAEKEVQKGKEALLQGDMPKAVALFEKALDMDRDNPAALLNLAVALKLKGELARAKQLLLRAQKTAADSPLSAEIERLLTTL